MSGSVWFAAGAKGGQLARRLATELPPGQRPFATGSEGVGGGRRGGEEGEREGGERGGGGGGGGKSGLKVSASADVKLEPVREAMDA